MSNTSSSYTPSPSLYSVNTISSSTPLNAPTQKDYSSAFAQLQSTYGVSGHTPVRPSFPKQSQQTSQSPVAAPYTPSPSHTQHSTSAQPKDYSLAYGNLCTSYGFAGEAPSLPSQGPKADGKQYQQSTTKSSLFKGLFKH